jgi:hypothetical protein
LELFTSVSDLPGLPRGLYSRGARTSVNSEVVSVRFSVYAQLEAA